MRRLISIAAVSSSLIAQVQVTVIVRDPLPAVISAWREDPTLVRVLITTAPGTPAHPGSIVGFELRDPLTNHVLARSRNGHPRQPRFDIPAGPSTLSLTGRELVEPEAVEVDRSIEAQVAATGLLPEGRYELCVRLYDRGLRPIAATGQLCLQARILMPDPPQLLSPADSSSLSTPTPLFIWTPIQPAVGSVRYRIRIAPVYGNQDRRSALERNAPVFEQDVVTTSLLYPPSAPPWAFYPDAIGFVWQVQALTPDGRPAARNEGKSPIFLFFPPEVPGAPEQKARRQEPPQRHGVGAPELLADTLRVTHIRLGGGFTMRLHTPVHCTVGSSCTLGPDTGFIFIPWLGDTLVVRFGSITISVPTGLTLPQLTSGTLSATIPKERLLRTGAAAVNHFLRILEWEFTALAARIRARVGIDWSGLKISCRTVDSVELGWQPITLQGLPPLRLKLPTAWDCSGNGLLLGPCFQAQFDSLVFHARFDTLPPRSFTGHLTLGGQFQISCLQPPVTAYAYLRLDRGGADLLLTLTKVVHNARLLGTPARVSMDTLVLDLSQDLNPAGFPPAGSCTLSDWNSPNWRGLWLPKIKLHIPIGDADTTDILIRNAVAEDGSGTLRLSFVAYGAVQDTIRLAGFRIRLDSLSVRWCRGTFQEFALKGLLILPPTLSKPADWAQLDSLRLRLTCDAAWNWTGSLELAGQLQLNFGTYARLTLQNGQLAKVAPGSGYLEFVNLRLFMPASGSNSIALNGLRIWNDGRVELEGAEGWINVASWANLSVAGVTIQVQEVGLGYSQPTGACASSTKRWWVGISGGIAIDASSGLPGGGQGVRVRRLRIYDNLCMTSDGAGLDVSVSGVFEIRGTLEWGTVTYGSGSGTVTAQGLRGSLSGRFISLGGLEAQLDFALGSTGSPAFTFWFVQGAAVVPGGVPIIPGAFHLVGGIVGAGWHVRLDAINRNQISETSGIVPPPPIVPDPNTLLLLRGGLIFADASVQFYRLMATGTVAIGSSMQLGIDGGITILPALNLVSGQASATVSLSQGRLQPPIALSGGVQVRLLRIPVFSTGFNTHLAPGTPCFTVGPLQKNWILADLDANVGNDILGAEVVAKAYAQLSSYLRLCPTEGSFTTNFSGAGVVGVKLQVAKVGNVPFHFGAAFSSGLCGYYLFRFQQSGTQYVGQAKLGGSLELAPTFDQSGWVSWGWKGTQAADHFSYCGSGNWVDIGRHWRHCRRDDNCNREVKKCRQVSIELRARGIFDGQLTIPRTCFTVAGRQICLPRLHQMSLSGDYGYYGYGRWNNREGAKKGGPLGDMAANLSCASLNAERQQWADDNLAQQQPPALVTSSTPGRGQTGVPITQIFRIELGAPLEPDWSGGSGLRQWQLRNVSVQLYKLGTGSPQLVSLHPLHSFGTTVSTWPIVQLNGLTFRTVLLPNTPYRLIVTGAFWAQNPTGSPVLHSQASDTIEFTTGAPEGFTFDVRSSSLPTGQQFRDIALAFTPRDLILYALIEPGVVVPLQFGRDLWLRIRDGAGKTYEWRGPTTSLIRSVAPQPPGGGVRLTWDTVQLQPRVSLNNGYSMLPNTFTLTVLNAKKAGSTASRPDTANRLLEALPLEIDRWSWTRFPSLAEQQQQLSTQLTWPAPGEHIAMLMHDEGSRVYTVLLHNTGSTKIFAGTPFWIRVRTNVGGTVTETRTLWHVPRTLLPSQSIVLSVSVPAQTGLQGVSIRVVPRAPFTELDPSDNCVDTGSDAGCARCQPPPECGVPAPVEETAH